MLLVLLVLLVVLNLPTGILLVVSSCQLQVQHEGFTIVEKTASASATGTGTGNAILVVVPLPLALPVALPVLVRSSSTLG